MQPTNHNPRRFRLESSEQRFVLLLGDALMAIFALLIALYIWASGDDWLRLSMEFLKSRAPAWFYFLPLMWMILLVELYDLSKAASRKITVRGIAIAVAIASVFYLIVYFASPQNSLPRLGVAAFIVVAAILTTIWRMFFIQMFSVVSRQKRALIIGAGKAGSTLANVIADQNPKPFNLIGLIDDDPHKLGTSIRGFPILGNYANLNQLITDQNITDLILAISNRMNHGMFQSILIAQEQGLTLHTMSETYENLTGRVPITLLESDWVIRAFLDKTPTSGFYRLTKRVLDFVIALLGFLFLFFHFWHLSSGWTPKVRSFSNSSGSAWAANPIPSTNSAP